MLCIALRELALGSPLLLASAAPAQWWGRGSSSLSQPLLLQNSWEPPPRWEAGKSRLGRALTSSRRFPADCLVLGSKVTAAWPVARADPPALHKASGHLCCWGLLPLPYQAGGALSCSPANIREDCLLAVTWVGVSWLGGHTWVRITGL